jgi:hypothetical protein
MSDQQDDIEKTTKMDDTPAAPEKKKGDWITMPMQAAKPADAPKPAAASQPAASQPASRPAPQASAPASAPAAAPSTPVSSGGMGSFLSNFGINDPNTQQWVLIGGGAVIFLCCGCSCLLVAFSFMGSFGN